MSYTPPEVLTIGELIDVSESVLSQPDIPVVTTDEEFRVDCAGLGWDIAGQIFAPDESRALRGNDGRKVGIFLLHGGGSDHRNMANLASLLATKFGIKAVTVTFPGHWYWSGETHDWPGEPTNDGTGRLRIAWWDRQNPIGDDEYEFVKFSSDPEIRRNRGSSFFAAAKPGTQFYHRQAAWPLAYEIAFTTACARNFPVDEYTLYLHGHSTGGPFAHMLLQRIENVAGLVGMESSPFGYIKKKMDAPGAGGERFPFNYQTLRTWRDRARYMGAEAGSNASQQMAMLMEDIFEAWEADKGKPGIKVEHFVQFAGNEALTAAATALGEILGYDSGQTAELVQRYLGYTKPLSGPGVRQVPPLLYIINENSRDHRVDNYNDVLFPELAKIEPAPKTSLTMFKGGIHNYNKAAEGLPRGVSVVGAKIWYDAIMGGFYEI